MSTTAVRGEQKPKVTISVPMDPENYDRLREFAAKTDRSLAWVLREGARRFIEAES